MSTPYVSPSRSIEEAMLILHFVWTNTMCAHFLKHEIRICDENVHSS